MLEQGQAAHGGRGLDRPVALWPEDTQDALTSRTTLICAQPLSQAGKTNVVKSGRVTESIL